MSEKNILVRGHMRFADNTVENCGISDNDFFHRFANKTYAKHIHSNITPLEIASNTSIIYKDMIELFQSLTPEQMSAPALGVNVDVYNHLKKEMSAALEELTMLGQICGISLKDIMNEKIENK